MLSTRLSITLLLVAACVLLTAADWTAHQVTCEAGFARLNCKWHVISVQSAVYGRRNKNTCSWGHPWWATNNTRCNRNVADKVAYRCNGRHRCTIGANNVVFGDPCRGTYKYLEVVYKCS